MLELTTPPADPELERLWEAFREARDKAHSADATLEDGLESGRRYWAFIAACTEHTGEI